MEFEQDTINLEGLEKLQKALKAKYPPYAKIGVLGGGKEVRKNEGKKNQINNAELAAVHEYGSPVQGIPSRSFLRMPLTDQLPKKLEEGGLFEEDEAREVLRTGTLMPWMKRVAAIALGVCKEAFTSNGWGKWPAWKPGYTNKTGQMLNDTGQLKDSVDAEVVEQ